MSGRLITGLAGLSVVVLALALVAGWWTSGTSDQALNTQALAGAADRLAEPPAQQPPGPIRRVLSCRIVQRELFGQGKNLKLVVEVTFERAPVRWRNTAETLPSQGTGTLQMEVACNLVEGRLSSWPLEHPRWNAWDFRWLTRQDEAESLWQRLDAEPEQAAEDAMLLTETTNNFFGGPLIYLSALRRKEMWKAAKALASSPEFKVWYGSASKPWIARADEELRLFSPHPPGMDPSVWTPRPQIRPPDGEERREMAGGESGLNWAARPRREHPFRRSLRKEPPLPLSDQIRRAKRWQFDGRGPGGEDRSATKPSPPPNQTEQQVRRTPPLIRIRTISGHHPSLSLSRSKLPPRHQSSARGRGRGGGIRKPQNQVRRSPRPLSLRRRRERGRGREWFELGSPPVTGIPSGAASERNRPSPSPIKSAARSAGNLMGEGAGG